MSNESQKTPELPVSDAELRETLQHDLGELSAQNIALNKRCTWFMSIATLFLVNAVGGIVWEIFFSNTPEADETVNYLNTVTLLGAIITFIFAVTTDQRSDEVSHHIDTIKHILGDPEKDSE